MKPWFHCALAKWIPEFISLEGGFCGDCRDIQEGHGITGLPWGLAAYERAGPAGRWGFTPDISGGQEPMAEIVRAGLIQQRWTGDKESMIAAAVDHIRTAASAGADRKSVV